MSSFPGLVEETTGNFIFLIVLTDLKQKLKVQQQQQSAIFLVLFFNCGCLYDV